MSTSTPLMGLTLPTIGVDTGLTWEQGVNANTNILDSHNHSSGSGSQISPSGININADFPFNSFSATGVASLVLSPVASLSTVNAVYSIGADLYYNDGNGNVVRITSGGTVNATSSGIASGTATASFVSSVLVVNSAANTPANIQAGSLLIGNNVASSKFVTLSAPSALASNYSLVLPALPAVSGNIMTMDTSGNISAVTNVDNSTLQISSNVISVKASGITASQIASGAVGTTQLASAAVTRAKIVALGQQVSGSSGSFGTTSTSFVDVTNLSVTITTTGNPVFLQLEFDGVGPSNGAVNCTNSPGTLRFVSGSTPIAGYPITRDTLLPCCMYSFMDLPAAGTYTYKIQVLVVTPAVSGVASVTSSRLTAYEAL